MLTFIFEVAAYLSVWSGFSVLEENGANQHNEQARTALKYSLTPVLVIWAYLESQESLVNKWRRVLS